MTAIHLVIMGVAGCGKSAVGQKLGQELGLPLIEGDDFHPGGNIRKMQQGVPLTDADRAEWLCTLQAELAARPTGAVLTCSALKARYREQLRSSVPALCFIHLAISQAQALQRVASRGAGHFYPPSLVASQFEALEDPANEPLVLALDATPPLAAITSRAVQWLRAQCA